MLIEVFIGAVFFKEQQAHFLKHLILCSTEE